MRHNNNIILYIFYNFIKQCLLLFLYLFFYLPIFILILCNFYSINKLRRIDIIEFYAFCNNIFLSVFVLVDWDIYTGYVWKNATKEKKMSKWYTFIVIWKTTAYHKNTVIEQNRTECNIRNRTQSLILFKKGNLLLGNYRHT